MCFGLDSAPPIPVISGAAVSHDDLVLEARDGNRFAAFLATPDEPSDKGVVILPDVRGLYRFYEEVALRFAERGYTALALDYFGRTAGVEKRDDEFEYRPHVDAVSPEQIQADVGRGCRAPALARGDVGLHGGLLHGRPPVLARGCGGPRARGRGRLLRTTRRGRRRLGAGRQQLAPRDRGAGAGAAGRRRTRTSPRRTTRRSSARSPKPGVEHELVVYEGAPHSFFDRKQDEFAAASEDAWARVLEFVERHGA